MRADPSSPDTVRDRDLLVRATGDVVLPPRTEETERDDNDYMATWEPDRALRADVVASIAFGERVRACAPERPEAGPVLSLRANLYDVVMVQSAGLYVHAVIVRCGSPVATWQRVGRADDCEYVLVAGEATFEPMAYLGERDLDSDAPDGLLVEPMAEGHSLVWLQNQAGNGIEVFAGLDPDGLVVAMFFQFH